MIEIEKKTVDIEEFSPTEPIYQENVIRHLIRLASLIVIGLLGVSVVQNYLPDLEDLSSILSPILIFTLMIVFLAGIFLASFQLRWVNEKRNKSTNLGGTVGLFGLFLTLISSVSSLIAIPLAVLIPLLGLGLLLTLVGFFAEMTRIDEPLVFWFRVNLEVIIRYTITIAGTLLVNWSALMIVSLFLVDWGVLTIFVWPGDLIGGLVIGGIGMVLVWGSWFHQINQTIWRYRVEIVRSIELSLSQGLILIALVVPFLEIPNVLFLSSIFGVSGLAIFYLDLYLFKVKVTSHFSKGFVTFSQVIASIIGFILIVIGMIQTQIPDWFFFSFYFPVTGLLLLYRVWFDIINHTVKRTVQTIVWFFRTYYREVITTIGVSFMAFGFFLFEFRKIINPLLMDFLKIDSFFDPLPIGLFLGGFIIGVAIWHIPDRHAYFRRVTTTLSATVVLWGILLLGLLLTPPPSTDELSYLISTTLIAVGISVDVWIWRSEIYHSIKNTLIALKNAIVHTYNTTIQFLKTYYRELITTGALSFMVYGLVVTWTSIIDFPYWPFLFLLIGYIASVAIWHIPDRHDYFRGVTTTLSTAVILFCFLLLLSPDYKTINWLSGGLVVIGVVVNGRVWRAELKQLVIQTANAIKNALVQTGLAIKNFFIAAKDALIHAGLVLIQFVDETLHVIWDHRIAIMRAFMTSVGSILTITSFLSWFGFHIIFSTWLIGFESLFLIFGVLFLYIAWFNQVNQFIKQSAIAIGNALVQTGHALYNFLVKIKNAIVNAYRTTIQFIKTYYVEILRYSTTFLGGLFLFTGLTSIVLGWMLSGFEVWLIGGGLALFWVAWLHQVNQFIKQSAIAIGNAFVQTGHALYNFLREVKIALMEALRTIWLYRVVILRVFATILGPLMILSVPVVPVLPVLEISSELELSIQLVLLIAGIGILYAAWFYQVNQFVKQLSIAIRNAIAQTIHAVYNFLVAAKNSIVAFSHYIWDHLIDILRAISTTTGFIFILAGLFSTMELNYFSIRFVLILGGIFLLYIAWFVQVNHFVKQSLLAIRDAIVQTAHAIHNFLVKVKNAMVNAYRTAIQFLKSYYVEILRYSTTFLGGLFLFTGITSVVLRPSSGNAVWLIGGGLVLLWVAWFHQVNQFIKQTARAIKNFFISVKNAILQTFRVIIQFFQTYYIEIIRYSATCIGVLSLIIGFMLMFQYPFGLLLIGSGLVLLYAAWFHQVNHFIKQSLLAIRDAIVHTAHTFFNFLINVKNAIIQAFIAFGSFMKKVGNQLEQLFRAAIDLTIPIVLIGLAISVLLYGFILLISGVINPSGVSTSKLFLSIPILGPILDFSASIIQGRDYNDNLLGVFAGDRVFLIPLGAALIVVGAVIFLFVALKKENMRLKSLLNSTSNIDSLKGGK